MKRKNPLLGLVYFDKDGNLWMDKKIPFGGETNPKVKAREWFYLLWDATEESRKKYALDVELDRMKKSWLGSLVTQWRTKNQLINKGYLHGPTENVQ